ncbi:hypothetical protein ACJX0J_041518 [Zea mays]
MSHPLVRRFSCIPINRNGYLLLHKKVAINNMHSFNNFRSASSSNGIISLAFISLIQIATEDAKKLLHNTKMQDLAGRFFMCVEPQSCHIPSPQKVAINNMHTQFEVEMHA